MPRIKRKVPEAGPSSLPSSDSRFPTEELRLRFIATTFIPMPTRYLSKSFFMKSCLSTVEVIDYYGLDNLVYCTSSVNIELCAEFYNNLVKIDDLTYSTRAGGRDIILTPEVLKDHLGFRHSSSTFLCFPPKALPFDDPYSHITLDKMYTYFFGEERTLTMSQFSSTRLRVHDYILYRVLVTCILPLNTRGVAIMRPFHSFLLYAFCHRLDVDIGLHMFHSIIYFSSIITNSRVYMPYCHILTSLLAALGVDVTFGNVKFLTEFDMIGYRQFSLAKIELDSNNILSWKRGAQPQSQPPPGEDEEMSDNDFSDLPPPSATPTLEDRVSRLEETMIRGFQRLEEQQQARHPEMMEMLKSWNRSHPPSD